LRAKIISAKHMRASTPIGATPAFASTARRWPSTGEAGDMTFIVSRQRYPTEERMSRKLSIPTLALLAALVAVPVMAQQPTDSAHKATAATTHHKSKHHKSSTKDTTKAATAKKDTTMKK